MVKTGSVHAGKEKVMAKINSVDGIADKVNLPPGSLIHVGQAGESGTEVSIYGYGPDGLTESEGMSGEIGLNEPGRPPVLWIRVRGLSDQSVMARIGAQFNLHALVLEDILNTHHRPKVEEFENYLFLIGHSFRIDPADKELTWDQVSFILGTDWVISFEERADSQTLSPMVNRLRASRGRSRTMGADYLFYALMDLAVDSCFIVLETLDEAMDQLEFGVMDQPDQNVLNRIYHLRRQALRLRRAAWPMRETANSLLRDESVKISGQVQPFLRDLYDHTVHILEASEALRENLSALMDLCLGQAGNRMNQIMKVLTVVGAIFIPLTFLAGLYGMNFKHMPELEVPWAYHALLGVMVVIAVGMVAFFKKKRWI